jgi:hypothetical protein
MSDYFSQNASFTMPFSSNSSWSIMAPIESTIKTKIEKLGIPLKEWNIQINRGILTGFNEAFIINSDTKEKLIRDSAESEKIIRPILSGKQIKRFFIEWSGDWLIFTRHGIDIEHYPSIKDHLTPFYENLKPKKESGEKNGRKPGTYQWYEIQDNIAYWKDFQKPKIIYPEITKFINFYFDQEGYYFTNNKCFILTGEHLEYLTCFFNSKLFRYCYINNFPELLGGTRELRKVFFQEIHVKKITLEINNLFKELLKALNINRTNKILLKQIEEEINLSIYSLYGITDKERELINSSQYSNL